VALTVFCFLKDSGLNPTPADRFFVFFFPSPSWKMPGQCLRLVQTRFLSHAFRLITHYSPCRMPYSLADSIVWPFLELKIRTEFCVYSVYDIWTTRNVSCCTGFPHFDLGIYINMCILTI
jgi:hypothetical protein